MTNNELEKLETLKKKGKISRDECNTEFNRVFGKLAKKKHNRSNIRIRYLLLEI